MVQVSERYFPSRLGRISSVAGSKSGAWRFTTSITACANPACVFPMTLMGKSQGNARTGESFSDMDGGGTHHLGLVLLVQRVDAGADGPSLSRVFAPSDRLSVEGCDGEHLPRGRGDPDFVRRAQLALGDGANLVRERVGAQDLYHHVVESELRRSEEHTSELQSRQYLVCRLLLEKKKTHMTIR